MNDRFIEIISASQHNLKGINLKIPLNKITVLTGPSGSGKSSLAMDVLFAEGQHRYLESLGFDAAYILKLWDKPQVEAIKNLPPSIALDQGYKIRNPNSTVASITGIDDIIKLLFVHAGTPHCPSCKRPLRIMNIDEMAEFIMKNHLNQRINIKVPIKIKHNINEYLKTLKKEGFTRILIDGEMINLDRTSVEPKEGREIFLLIDRILINEENRPRLIDSISTALKIGNSSFSFDLMDKDTTQYLTEKSICPHCDLTFPEINTRIFSKDILTGLGVTNGELDKNHQNLIISLLSETALNILIKDKNYLDFLKLSFEEVHNFLADLTTENPAVKRIVDIISKKIETMLHLHLGYITLNRSAISLSRGELQRLRIGIQIGKEITGILYILDEPTVGLHKREQESLWENILRLKEQGNTVLIIEHNLDFIKRADFIIELGPGAGQNGGEVVFQGDFNDLIKSENSVTAPYLMGKKRLSRKKRLKYDNWIVFENLQKNNLKIKTLKIPLNSFVCVCGVSGSGKTTLVFDEIYEKIRDANYKVEGKKPTKSLNVICIDQLPISSSTSSMVCTYLGIFDPIRNLFAKTNEAKIRGVNAGFFSLNKKGGRCEECQGQGYKVTQLDFLPPVRSLCSRCLGKRYSKDALEIKFKGQSMADVLEMDISSAREYFLRFSDIRLPLESLERLGLNYLKLGQLTNTLSGGEAQRLKLARELYKSKEGSNTVFLLDEPTQGLHSVDIEPLIEVLGKLIDAGHSIIMIEHHEEILKIADWVIDLGDKGGDMGGKIVYEGSEFLSNL